MSATVLSAQEAAGWIRSGDTVLVGGVVSMVTPEAVLRALGERYEVSAAPRDLTLICPNRTGWEAAGERRGIEHFARSGMVAHIITSTFNDRVSPRFMRLVMQREVQTSVVPMGVLFRWLRECSARSPGLLTQVGLGTFFDPRTATDDGAVTAHARRVAQRVSVDGRDCIFMPSMPIDVTLIRGTVADTDGNLSLVGEPVNGGALQMAMAARNSGGRTIAVVRELTRAGSLHPRLVQVPGIFVDAVVVDPDARQSQEGRDEPAYTGEIRRPAFDLPAVPMGCDKVILRRAALSLCKGDIVNLGFGMGVRFPAIAAEEGFLDDLVFSVEHGAIGGLPSSRGAFGAHVNPRAIIDPTDLFDFYHGGGLDATILGFAEVDAQGNVNVGGAYTGALRGPGGFVDIVHATRTVLICGTLTSGGIEASFDAGRVAIRSEGRHRKFRRRVGHIDLCGPAAAARGQRVQVVTERCVFEVREEGLTLCEVAPGIDVERQIAPFVDFELRVAPELRVMDDRLYANGRAGLALGERSARD